MTIHQIAYDFSRADWDGLRDHLRDVPWEWAQVCEWAQVGIDVYILSS